MKKIPKKIKLNGPVIGDGSTWLYDWLNMPYISASKISKELDDARGDDVELYINSGGGSVFAGSEGYTILKEYPGKVTAKITGVAASAASFLAMAADEIMMSPTSQMMIHNAATWTDGDKNAHSSNTNMLHGTDIAITNAYRLKTGRNTDELLELMNKTTWMNAQQAVELGFADGILFDEGNSLIAVSNNILGEEIPPDVEAKLRDIVIANALKGNGDTQKFSNLGKNPFDGLDVSAILPHVESLSKVTNQMLENKTDQQRKNDPQMKEEHKAMDMNELQSKYPDLYNEIIARGVTQERGRITQLNALAGAPGAREIIAKAIENGTTAGEAAMEIVKASQERLSNEAKNRVADSKNSGAEDVPADEAPNDKPDPEAAAKQEADALVAEIKALRGAK
ncbi:head maturation protease, ClpP-related [Brevibacillus nitrificans]|uniref:head maturation protease, ClpP-related n=1 Tax=Brevibacillus nitrificans TaxID=651560 RepID=UPI00285D910F|nr:head maturation protease, ClpP-related [Brevibacillus nitrificans]MDR7318907.1 ATP-dependent protease ClpP protease subunit [Brevibacillus nitrificans]